MMTFHFDRSSAGPENVRKDCLKTRRLLTLGAWPLAGHEQAADETNSENRQLRINRSERAKASEPPERSGDHGAPASDGVRGSGGTKSPGHGLIQLFRITCVASPSQKQRSVIR
jgi:hypothetical protein